MSAIEPPVLEWIEEFRMWAVVWPGGGVVGNYRSHFDAEAAAIEAVKAEEARARA